MIHFSSEGEGAQFFCGDLLAVMNLSSVQVHESMENRYATRLTSTTLLFCFVFYSFLVMVFYSLLV